MMDVLGGRRQESGRKTRGGVEMSLVSEESGGIGDVVSLSFLPSKDRKL